MFETVDFVSLPLSESEILFELIRFITSMFIPNGENEVAQIKQYPLIRVSVLEPAKPFLTFIINNRDRLILNEQDKAELENRLCWIHRHVTNMEARFDEHDADFVSELVKWEMQMMVEMENKEHLKIIFRNILNRAWHWRRNQPERQKRREVRLREEGWDDAFELRVVGIGENTNQGLVGHAADFRVELAFNADEL
ncbi:hypothetical protein BLNAU_20595 [Blattamonas nauphoetae]|uniref:Uncharacterized protein n=1 Tax=Blattamonas nauphoetae TaxID=2049346 RepID=A0ABQ9WYA1_9EUKA|nr:hypothetical protein BLNAU_20595 [Blattamonas nauphoetae]